MTDTVAHISEADHARLVDLLDERRRTERKRKLAMHRASRQALSLAQKLEADAPFKEKLVDLNGQIDELMKQTGGTL